MRPPRPLKAQPTTQQVKAEAAEQLKLTEPLVSQTRLDWAAAGRKAGEAAQRALLVTPFIPT
jgi:hypothetical protein